MTVLVTLCRLVQTLINTDPGSAWHTGIDTPSLPHLRMNSQVLIAEGSLYLIPLLRGDYKLGFEARGGLESFLVYHSLTCDVGQISS